MIDATEQRLEELARRLEEEDDPEWQQRVQDEIDYLQTNLQEMLNAQRREFDEWEEPPMTTGGDPSEGDQLGEVENAYFYRAALFHLEDMDAETNEHVRNYNERFDGILRGEIEATDFDLLDAMRIQRNSLPDGDRVRDNLWTEIQMRLIDMYDAGETPVQEWQYLSITELQQALRSAGRRDDADQVESIQMERWNQGIAQDRAETQQARNQRLNQRMQEVDPRTLFDDATFMSDLDYALIDAVEDADPAFTEIDLDENMMREDVEYLFDADLQEHPESNISIEDRLERMAALYISGHGTPENVLETSEQARVDRAIEEDILEGIDRDNQVRTTIGNEPPADFETTGETVTTDDLDALFEEFDRLMDEQTDAERTADDDEWEEPPGTTGGDPAEGDQLGDTEEARLNRQFRESEVALVESINTSLERIRANPDALQNSEMFLRLRNPSVDQFRSEIQAWVTAERRSRNLPRESIPIDNLYAFVSPFLVAMQQHIRARRQLDEYRSTEGEPERITES